MPPDMEGDAVATPANAIGAADRRAAISGSWPEIRRGIGLTWGVFADDELERADDWDELVAVIRAKTGESVAVVEAKLDFVIEALPGDPQS